MTSSLLEIGKQTDWWLEWLLYELNEVQAFTATVLKQVFLNNLNAAKVYLIIKNRFFCFLSNCHNSNLLFLQLFLNLFTVCKQVLCSLVLCLFSSTQAATSLRAVCLRDGPWAWLWRTIIGRWRRGVAVPVVVVSCCEPFALLFFHEQLHHENLLFVHLKANVLGDIRDQPVHEVTHEHHHILQRENSHIEISQVYQLFQITTHSLVILLI